MPASVPLLADPPAFLRRLFAVAVAAVQPARCVPPALADLPACRRIVAVGAGKAAAAMAAAAENALTGAVTGLVVTRDGYGCPTRRIEVAEAAHPVPDARGVTAAQRILALARAAGPDDLLLCLLSGGASALLTLPIAGLTLDDKRTITATLLRAGAAIQELNCVRKHLSAIKGGRLAAAAGTAQVLSLVISDVVGDDPAVIASGPTVADPTTCADALAILNRYDVPLPSAVRAGLENGAFETPKRIAGGQVRIVARPADALAAAAAEARAAGLGVIDLGDRCEGEAQAVACAHAAQVQAVRADGGAPRIILSGGELTVHVRGDGRGGPNTEYALALAQALEGATGVWALAADTDGTDGTCDAAGAIVAPDTLARARSAGLTPGHALARNDSGGFFARLGDLLRPGPTMTNVNDLRAILVLPDP
jgi:hydroxypyruvate reductase